MTLLEKALAYEPRHKTPYDAMDIEIQALVVAWLTGRIRAAQALVALGADPKEGTILYRLAARISKQLIAEGKLQFVKPLRGDGESE